MLPGGSHQRRQPKHDDVATAAPGEKQDEPASKYARMQWFLVTWLVCDNALLTFGSLGKKSTRAASFHLEMLIFPISISLCMLYIFGTLDSLAVGTYRAPVIWVCFWVYQAVFTAAAMLARGEPFSRALVPLFSFLFMATAFGGLVRILRQELRELGSLDATTRRITTRLLEIMSLQAALVVIGLTRGIGRNAFNRIAAAIYFSISLIMAWLYSLAIFDVAGVDAVAATQLQLRPIEGAALSFTGLFVLAGLASYFLSEQSRPKRKTVLVVGDTLLISMFGAYICTARIVWVARRKRRSKVSDDDLPA